MRMLFLCALVALFMTAASVVPSRHAPVAVEAPQQSGLSIVGGYGGALSAATQRDPYAYIVEGNRLAVLDTRDPTHFVRVSQAPLSAVPFRLELVGSVVAAFEWQYSLRWPMPGERWLTIELIDVTDPLRPAPRGNYDGYGSGDSLDAFDTYGALLYFVSNGRLQIVDLQDGAHPALRSNFALRHTPTALLATEDTLYVASCYGLETIDVSLPVSPQYRGSVERGDDIVRGCGEALAKAGSFVYVASDQRPSIVDVSDPALPNWRGSVPLDYLARSVTVAGSTAIVAASLGPTRLSWFDVQNPDNPQPLDTIDLQSMSSLVSSGDVVTVGTPEGLIVLDASDPRDVRERARFPLEGGVSDLALAGQRVLVVTQSQGLHIFDLHAPGLPALVPAYQSALFYAGAVRVVGGIAFVSDGASLVLLDVRDPANPMPRARFELGDGLKLLQVREVSGIAFVALADSLWVFDIHDAAAPLLLARVDGPTLDVAVSGGVVAVAAGAVGVNIVDASDPRGPQVVGSYPTLGAATRVWSNGEVVYVAEQGRGLLVLDLSQPQAPQLRGSYAAPAAFAAEVVEAMAYVRRDNSLEVVDLSIPDAPRLRGSSRDAPGEMWVEGDRVYFSFYGRMPGGALTMLSIIDAHDPDQPRLVTALTGYGGGMLVTFGNLVADVSGDLTLYDTTTPGLLRRIDMLPFVGCWRDSSGQRVGSVLYLACGVNGLVIVQAQQRLLPVETEIGPAGGEVRSADGGVRLVLPPDAVALTSTLRYQWMRWPGHLLPFNHGVVRAFALTVTDDDGTAVQLQRAATLEISYTNELLAAASVGDEASLVLLRWDGDAWRQLFPCDTCTLDIAHQRLVVPIDAGGEFVLVGENSMILLPLVARM